MNGRKMMPWPGRYSNRLRIPGQNVNSEWSARPDGTVPQLVRPGQVFAAELKSRKSTSTQRRRASRRVSPRGRIAKGLAGTRCQTEPPIELPTIFHCGSPWCFVPPASRHGFLRHELVQRHVPRQVPCTIRRSISARTYGPDGLPSWADSRASHRRPCSARSSRLCHAARRNWLMVEIRRP